MLRLITGYTWTNRITSRYDDLAFRSSLSKLRNSRPHLQKPFWLGTLFPEMKQLSRRAGRGKPETPVFRPPSLGRPYSKPKGLLFALRAQPSRRDRGMSHASDLFHRKAFGRLPSGYYTGWKVGGDILRVGAR